MPIGLYRLNNDQTLRPRSIVSARPGLLPHPLAQAHARASPARAYIKRIAALHGDFVCADSAGVSINHGPRIERMIHDTSGRALSYWTGCRRLEHDEVFLLGDTADSFDSRYWGPAPRAAVEAVWRPLWTSAAAFGHDR